MPKTTIDWSRPAYVLGARKATERVVDAGHECDLCGARIRLNERITCGPRGTKYAHIGCIPLRSIDRPPSGEVVSIGALPPHVCQRLELDHLGADSGEGYAILRADVEDLRRMPLNGRVFVTAEVPSTPTLSLATIGHVLARADRLTKREFVAFMAPLYRGDTAYAEGLWPQFCQGPLPFMLSRNPREPGEKLLAMLAGGR